MHCVRSLLSNLRRIKPNSDFNRVTRVQERFRFPIYFQDSLRFISNSIDEDVDLDNIIDELCKGDPECEKKLRILMLEVEVMRQDGRQAPSSLLKDNWEHLMTLSSRNQRSGYLSYLWKTEMAKKNQKAKKEARRKEREESEPEMIKEYPDDVIYSIQQQSLFLRIRDGSINNFDNYRALQAILNGQPVVIDCSYEEHMVWREAMNAAKQMTFVFGDNRIHKNPFNVYMCNVNKSGDFMKQLHKNIPSLHEPWFPMNITTESYLDIFPKEKLVYLTPHCRNELTEFDHDAVYIIGCMVDKINNEPLSLAKAKRDGIKMAKLPLDRYLEWAPGAKKNLNINHMVPILLDLKLTGDWDYSLRHIPRRKLMETKIVSMQNKLKTKPYLRDEILKNFKNNPRFTNMIFNNKRQKSKQSLYHDDDNV